MKTKKIKVQATSLKSVPSTTITPAGDAEPNEPHDLDHENWPAQCSLPSMAGDSPDLRQLSPQQIWESLFHQLVLFAHYQINRVRWRGAHDGLLPEGYDASSLAAQAIYEFLLRQNPNPPGPDSLQAILWELKRTILRQVTRLYHRRENFIVCSSEQLAPVAIDDGEFCNPIELIPDSPAGQPDSIALENESLAAVEALKSRFSSFLKPEGRLRNYFHRVCESDEKPRVLAARTGLRPAEVKNLSKQLRRRWRKCFGRSAIP